MKTLLSVLLALMLSTTAFGLGLRLDDIGQGAAPGLTILGQVPMTENLFVGAGFGRVGWDEDYEQPRYIPRGDLTASSGPIFGRIGAWLSGEKEWAPFYGAGLNYPITEAVGIEFFYVFGFDKHPSELEYTETLEGDLVLNVWANF